MGKHNKNNKHKKILIMLFIFVLIISIGVIIRNNMIENIENEKIKDTSKILENIDVGTIDKEGKSERSLQLKILRKEYPNVIGWLEISGTKMNYPVCQAQDNDYYLNHSYKKEKNKSGSLFIDMENSIDEQERNLLIYGHRNKYGYMFEDLIKYKNKEFWKANSTIRFTTEIDDEEYIIFAVVRTRVFYQDEANVFRYYNFACIEGENEYNKYIEEMKKLSLYDTDIEPKNGEKLLTLSTCEYSQKNGRFVVVAKKLEE